MILPERRNHPTTQKAMPWRGTQIGCRGGKHRSDGRTGGKIRCCGVCQRTPQRRRCCHEGAPPWTSTKASDSAIRNSQARRRGESDAWPTTPRSTGRSSSPPSRRPHPRRRTTATPTMPTPSRCRRRRRHRTRFGSTVRRTTWSGRPRGVRRKEQARPRFERRRRRGATRGRRCRRGGTSAPPMPLPRAKRRAGSSSQPLRVLNNTFGEARRQQWQQRRQMRR
mmetsp:Transcript_39812/g.73416  ORF Transcript_39812/g.73416 Transcript_39812/m.73416 type:complete len:223 (+) Transcript_39812:1776-2444(+)